MADYLAMLRRLSGGEVQRGRSAPLAHDFTERARRANEVKYSVLYFIACACAQTIKYLRVA